VDRLPRLLLTHTDLDGIGAAVVWTASTGAPYRIVENGEVDRAVSQALTEAEEVVLADHSIAEMSVPLVEAHLADGHRFQLLDHHKSALPLARYPWATVDVERSGTGLVFDYLGRPAPFREFAQLVEDNDLWQHADPRSSKLAALYELLGEDRFMTRFTADPQVTFTEGEELLLAVEARRESDYIERKVEEAEVIQIDGVRWAVVWAEAYRSTLAQALMERLEVEASAIVNANSDKVIVSLRGRDVDVALVAEAHGGGGHARAAAFSSRTAGIDEGRKILHDAIVLALSSASGSPASG
jgi:oligoribonuclease NrnB/cAMP/cGMP phosphodiesterase (DHH superfamily)